MRFGQSADQEGVTLELTPLIDVVLLLVLFFMVTIAPPLADLNEQKTGDHLRALQGPEALQHDGKRHHGTGHDRHHQVAASTQ